MATKKTTTKETTAFYSIETLATDKGWYCVSENLSNGYTTLTVELSQNLRRITRSASCPSKLDRSPISLIEG